MKIGVLIDPHITDRHRCRKDDFLSTALDKLEYVAQNNDYVLICGDLFHTNSNSHLIFYKVYQLMNKYRGKFIAIPGNHDLIHNNLAALEKTTIGSLALTGVLDLKFKGFKIGSTEFEVSHVMKNLEAVPVDEDNCKVLIGHNYLELPGAEKESLTREEIRKLNYDIVFLGHEHKPYDEELIGNTSLVRMGSLTRIDTQPYNKNREICYYQLDSETRSYERKVVPSKPDSEVYNLDAFLRSGKPKEEIDYIKVGEVLAKFKRREEGVLSLHDKLTKIATENEIEYIKNLHEMYGVRYF